METVAKLGEFKGSPLLQIWKEGEDEKKPRMAMGIVKCKLVVKHLAEIKAFIDSQEEEVFEL